jgi:hypothetical protein
MSPQFVDFNADGKTDIVAGIFDGSPHLARGSDKGFEQPMSILDREGSRIVLNTFWNFDTKKWDSTKRCDPVGHNDGREGHFTSAVAMDLDGDGDPDLLLGDRKSGRIWIRRNEGKAGEPLFATRNEALLVNGKPTDVPGEVATLRPVDWNGDGLTDLAVGSMGESSGTGGGGGVYVFLNCGTAKEARFGPMQTILAASPSGAAEAARPDVGLYMDFADVDGDGDLDMAVGGYSVWIPPARTLDSAEEALLASLRKELEGNSRDRSKLDAEMEKATAGLSGAAEEAKQLEFYEAHKADYSRVAKERTRIREAIDKFVPSAQRKSAVWLYEQRTPSRKSAPPSP